MVDQNKGVTIWFLSRIEIGSKGVPVELYGKFMVSDGFESDGFIQNQF